MNKEIERITNSGNSIPTLSNYEIAGLYSYKVVIRFEIKHFFSSVSLLWSLATTIEHLLRQLTARVSLVCSPQSISRHLEFRSKQLQLGSPYKKLITTPNIQGIIRPPKYLMHSSHALESPANSPNTPQARPLLAGILNFYHRLIF